MAFPVIESRDPYYQSSGTSHNIDMPSGIQAWDLILVVYQNDWSNDTPSAPTWRTRLYNQEINEESAECALFYRVADGTEWSTVAFNTNSSEAVSAIAMRISWTDTSKAPEISALTDWNTATPNPSSLTTTFTWDIMFLAIVHVDDGITITSVPSWYTGGYNTTYSAHPWAHLWYKNSTSNTEDPGTFNLWSVEHCTVVTVGIAWISTVKKNRIHFFT